MCNSYASVTRIYYDRSGFINVDVQAYINKPLNNSILFLVFWYLCFRFLHGQVFVMFRFVLYCQISIYPVSRRYEKFKKNFFYEI